MVAIEDTKDIKESGGLLYDQFKTFKLSNCQTRRYNNGLETPLVTVFYKV